MKMAGPFLDPGNTPGRYAIDRGRIMEGGTSQAFYSRVLLPRSMVSVEPGGPNVVEVTMDMARWLQDPHYDFNEYAVDMAGDPEAQRILRRNAPSVYMHEDMPTDTLIFAPPGFPPMVVPPDNPTTTDGVLLGRMLYYDPILSGDSTLACAGCHMPERAFTDDKRFSVGIDGIEGDRNAPAVINVGWMRELFWDGRAPGVEDQARQPVTNPIEMHLEWAEAVSRLEAHPTYPRLFTRAFGTPEISEDRVVKAIAQFERTMVSANSKYDRWFRGEDVFTESELNGFTLFFTEVGDCFHCHVGDNGLFTDNLYHNIGLESEIVDVGRYAVTGRESDRGLFKTPTLRNLDFTAPYMHDGRFQTLDEVVQHYNSGGHPSPTVDPLIRVNVGLGLTDSQKRDLIAFLRTLNDPGFVENPAFWNPFE
jgi:cytochrome c peroxidase